MSGKLVAAAKQILKGIILSLILTLVLVLAFACIMKATLLSSDAIFSVNAVIKILAVFLGCLFFLRVERGAIKGSLLGASYALLSSFIFGVMSKTAPAFSSLALNFFICGTVGAVSGIISVNFFSKES